MSVKEKFKIQRNIEDLSTQSSHRLFKFISTKGREISTKPNPRKAKMKFFKGKGNILDLAQHPEKRHSTTYSYFHCGANLKDKPKN